MIIGLLANLGDYGGNNWSEYIRSRNLWVTETNCYWEEVNPTPDKWTYEFPHPDSKEQCLRITGQMEDTHGQGSIATMEEITNIERYSLWTTWNKQIKPNYLVYKSGKHLTPLGKAYLNPGDDSVECEFPGERINVDNVDNVTLGGNAEVIVCEGTGTKMVRNLDTTNDATNSGTVTFTVDVPSAGDYAVNVAYILSSVTPSNVIRKLRVTMNDDAGFERFSFISSGTTGCDQGGKSTVLPIELQGFKAGSNTIRFRFGDTITLKSGTSGESQPYIEWISVVV